VIRKEFRDTAMIFWGYVFSFSDFPVMGFRGKDKTPFGGMPANVCCAECGIRAVMAVTGGCEEWAVRCGQPHPSHKSKDVTGLGTPVRGGADEKQPQILRLRGAKSAPLRSEFVTFLNLCDFLTLKSFGFRAHFCEKTKKSQALRMTAPFLFS